MVDEPQSNGQLDPVIQPFVDFWAGYVKHTDDKTRDLFEVFDTHTNLKSWQRQWYDAVSKSMDAYMRSPLFLQSVKQNIDAMIKTKQQIADLAGELARNANIPTAGDISGLFERLHSIEEVMLGQLGRIEERLATIEQQLGAGQPVSS